MKKVLNRPFQKMVEDLTTPWNSSIMNVLSTEMVKDVMGYLDKIVGSAMLSLNREIKLEYTGYKKLTPDEEFKVVSADGEKKKEYDFGRSDVRMVRLFFDFEGEPITPKNLYIPFVDEHGILHISDTKYLNIPVLSDTIVSPTSRNIFTRLLRDKVTFERESKVVLLNGRVLDGDLIYKNLYRTQNRVITDNLGKVVTPSPAYLFGEYGLIGTFERYAQTTPIIIYGEVDAEKYKDYDIYSSTGDKPWSLKLEKEKGIYTPHDAKLLVLKEFNSDYFIQVLAVAFFYMLDVFPHLAEELVDTINSNNVEDEVKAWMILLSKIIFKNSYSAERGLGDMINHFQSLKSYIDPIVKEKLAENGLVINQFFDLIAYVCGVFKQLTTNYKLISADIRNRYVDILYYILYDIFEALIKTLFELNKKRDRGMIINRELIDKTFNQTLSSKKIFNLNSKNGVNISLLLSDSVGDSKLKLACSCELQENGKGVNKAPRQKHAIKILPVNPTSAVFGSIYNVSKSYLDERRHMNPFVKLNQFSRVVLSPERLEYIKCMDNLLNGTVTIKQSEVEDLVDAVNDNSTINI